MVEKDLLGRDLKTWILAPDQPKLLRFYDYTVEVRNRFKGLDLIECLMNYGMRFVTLDRRQGSGPSPWKRNAKNKMAV